MVWFRLLLRSSFLYSQIFAKISHLHLLALTSGWGATLYCLATLLSRLHIPEKTYLAEKEKIEKPCRIILRKSSKAGVIVHWEEGGERNKRGKADGRPPVV